MTNNSYGLAQRARRVLIMVNGKRSNSEIAATFTEDNAETILANLIENGFVAPLQSAPAATSSPDKPADSVPPPLDDTQRFEMAKNFMCNMVKAFLGSMGSDLTNQIERCRSIDELRLHHRPWSEAIAMTSDGRKQLQTWKNDWLRCCPEP